VVLAACKKGIVLDGFNITNGNSNGLHYILINNDTVFQNKGAGILLIGGNNTFRNNLWYNNNCAVDGAAIYSTGANLNLENNSINNNSAGNNGGGIFLYNGNSVLSKNVFIKNTAGLNGAGFYGENGSQQLNANAFGYNIAQASGAGIYIGAGSISMKNNLIYSNQAGTFGGGALLTNKGGYPTNNVVINNTVYNNFATNGGGIFTISNCSNTIQNNIFWKNTAFSGYFDYGNSDCQNVLSNNFLQLLDSSNYYYYRTTYSNNIFKTDPLFLNASNPLGDDNIAGTNDDGFNLISSSAAINKGLNTGTPTQDIKGLPRIQNATVDIGAYETNYLPIHIRYVRSNASGTGASWAAASPDLQLILNASLPGDSVWVAKGIYYPSRDLLDNPRPADNREKAFNLKQGVVLAGGFAGNERTAVQRNPTSNITVLSGDIGKPMDSTDNCYHVVVAFGRLGITIDGFTITGGNSNGADAVPVGGGFYANDAFYIFRYRGAGIYIDNQSFSGGNYYGPNTIAHCIICDNSALPSGAGAGIFLSDGKNSVNSNQIFNNKAMYGAGVINFGGQNDFTFNVIHHNQGEKGAGIGTSDGNNFIAGNKIYGNTAYIGGAMYIYKGQNMITRNCVDSNYATNGGGGIYLGYFGLDTVLSNSIFNNSSGWNGGGICIYEGNNAIINNCIYNNIAATAGGGIYDEMDTDSIWNNTIYGNSAQNGGGLFAYHNTIGLVNNIFWKNLQNGDSTVAGADYSTDNKYLYPASGVFKKNVFQLASTNNLYQTTYETNLDNLFAINPLFVNTSNPAGADNIPGTRDDGFRLQSNSPALDAGTNLGYPLNDITGSLRMVNGKTGIGAYETGDSCSIKPILAMPALSSICKGDSMLLEAKSTYANTHYTWYFNDSPFVNDSNYYYAKQTGVYTVRDITCNIIADPDTVKVNSIPDQPHIVYSPALSVCSSDSIVLTTDVHNINQWYNDGTKLVGDTIANLIVKGSGIYWVTVGVPGCQKTSAIDTVVIIPVPVTPEISWDGKLLSTDYVANLSYQWILEKSIIPNAGKDTLTPHFIGTYYVKVADTVGCTVTSDGYQLTALPAAPGNPTAGIVVNVYPNPSANIINVDVSNMNSDVLHIQLLNMNGKLIKSITSQQQNNIISLAGLSRGAYFVAVDDGKSRQVIKILVVQ
jgi:hypothetical protein